MMNAAFALRMAADFRALLIVNGGKTVCKLNNAEASSELKQFGVIELSVGQEVVFTTSSNDMSVVVGASVGGVVCVVLLVAAVWRWRKYLSQVHGCSSLVQVSVPYS